jgi:TRAP-type C4-dicarboxylate transport system substrate-binding protein
MMTSKTCAALAALGALAALAARPVAAKDLKIATVAPDGTSWMTIMEEFDKELREKTGGKLGLKLYPGGVAGDERTVLKKMKAGQLQGGAFTGMGLGEIHSWVRLLEMPFQYRDYGEVDYVRGKLEDRICAEYEKRGYVLIAWAEVGFTNLFSSRKLMNLGDVRASKPWVWDGDALASGCFAAFGVNPTPLALPDVMTSLQTGLIDTVYASPMACIGLQWFSKVKYMLAQPIGDGQGALLIQKSFFDRLPADEQAALRELGKKYGDKLREVARKENADAIPTLKEKGIEVITWAPEDLDGLAAIGAKGAEDLAGDGPDKLYPRALLDEVRGLLAEYRAKHAGAAPAPTSGR